MPRYIEELSTTGLTEYTGDPADASMWGWVNDKLIEWMGEICDPQLGTITNPGTGYVDGVYPNVELRRTASTQNGGNNLLCEVTISGGGVSSVVITQKGNGFATGDELNIPNVAQVGGTGSGFTIEVASADSSLGMIYDVTRSGTSYPRGWLIGADRDAGSYNIGAWINRTSVTSTWYTYDFYGYTPSTSNNGYGTITNNHSPSINAWYNSNGDGHTLRVIYSSEPGDRWFAYTDTAYLDFWFIAEMNQPAPNDYPTTSLITRWGLGQGGSSLAFRPFSTVNYTTAYFGNNQWAPPRPSDQNVVFSGGAIYGRSYLAGVLPPGLGYSAQFSGWTGRQLQQGTEVWDAFGECMFGRTSL